MCYLSHLNPCKFLSSSPSHTVPSCLVPYPSLNCPFPVPYPSLTYPLPIPYLSLTCPLPVPFLSLTCLLPVSYLSLTHPLPTLTHPLPVPYLSLTRLASLCLSRSHKGTGTDTIFDFSHPPPTTTSKLFKSLYSPLCILYTFHTCPLPLLYPFPPPTLPLLYPPTCP